MYARTQNCAPVCLENNQIPKKEPQILATYAQEANIARMEKNASNAQMTRTKTCMENQAARSVCLGTIKYQVLRAMNAKLDSTAQMAKNLWIVSQELIRNLAL